MPPTMTKTKLTSFLSLEDARTFSRLPAEKKMEFVSTLTDAEAAQLRYLWEAWARDKQLAPVGKWVVWLIMAGRGFGKTRSGAEWIRKHAENGKVRHMSLIGRTAADVRDVMVEGESGILACSPSWAYPKYEPSKRRLTWPNGCTATTFSADEPDALRGPQHEKVWADEPAAWQYQDTWDQMMFGLRLGSNPQCVATTTPRPTKLIKALFKAKTTHITKGTTYENRENLASTFFSQVVGRYEGTRLGQQELYAELLDDADGALWKREAMIEAYRVTSYPDLVRIVVGVDPAVSDHEDSAETGIVVAGIDASGHGYVLDDKSQQMSPHTWASEVVASYYKYKADRVIGEQNNGGILVETNIRTVDKDVSYKQVYASRGKYTRAEPVASLYEQGKIHHVGLFPLLEDQMCQWEPLTGQKSPDRLDALVWALTELIVARAGSPGVLDLEEQTAEEQAQNAEALKKKIEKLANPFEWAAEHEIGGDWS